MPNGNLLVVTGDRSTTNGRQRFATVFDWHNDTIVDRFPVRRYTHDVDYLGDGRYAVADLDNSTAYVYDRTNDTVVWEWRFRDHYSSSAGGGHGGYTHLNDIDAVDNGSAFLLSPRNFDRVILVDRETGTVNYTLGREDATDILYEQHNPVLLTDNPPTILVADSENDRVIEYRRRGDTWEPIWSFQGHEHSHQDDLHWPRDADRLPNGDTLIVDTANDRTLIVTPSRNVTWQYQNNRLKAPYDAEILQYGDEAGGPSMSDFKDEFNRAIVSSNDGLAARLTFTFTHAYFLVTWIVPAWFSIMHFASILGAFVVLIGWVNAELTAWNRDPVERLQENIAEGRIRSGITGLLSSLAVVLGLALIIAELFPNPDVSRGIYIGIGTLLVLSGVLHLQWVLPPRFSRYLLWPARALRLGALAVAILLLVLSIRTGQVVLSDLFLTMAVLLAITVLAVHDGEHNR